jgi:hypothetical protein
MSGRRYASNTWMRESTSTVTREQGDTVMDYSITPEAAQLLASADAGGVPSFIPHSMRRIAAENGIDIDGDTTPEIIVAALRRKRDRSAKMEETPASSATAHVQLPNLLLGRLLDQGKASAYAVHLLAIKMSKGLGFVLNNKHLEKNYGISDHGFRKLGLPLLTRTGVLEREQPGGREFATEKLAETAGGRGYVAIPDALLTQDSDLIALIMSWIKPGIWDFLGSDVEARRRPVRLGPLPSPTPGCCGGGQQLEETAKERRYAQRHSGGRGAGGSTSCIRAMAQPYSPSNDLRPTTRSPVEDVRTLARASSRRGGSAYALLDELRDIFGAGETFTLTPKVMARRGVLPGWTRERYENARDVLLRTGYIELVSAFAMTLKGPVAARYRLANLG